LREGAESEATDPPRGRRASPPQVYLPMEGRQALSGARTERVFEEKTL